MRVGFIAIFTAPPCRFLHNFLFALISGTRKIECLIIVAQVVDIPRYIDELRLDIVMVFVIIDLALKLSNQKFFFNILARHILLILLSF